MLLLVKALGWILSSSDNPQKYSKTFQGLVGFIPAVIALQQVFGYNIFSAEDLGLIAGDLDASVVGFFAAVSGLWTLYGLVKKVANRVKSLF